MKTFIAAVLILAGIILGVAETRISYLYSNAIGSYWALSEKASTLQQKSTYLDKYVAGLESAELAPHNAIIYPTPNNSVEQNLVALKSLQGRMHQIQGMDEQSFAYQTAIQQITAQEQGEAHQLTETFEGAWLLANHPIFWGWINGLIWVFIIVPLVGLGIKGLVDIT